MVIPTRRLLLLGLVGVPVAGISGSHSAALVVAVLWLTGVAMVATIDCWFAPDDGGLTWSRQHQPKLSLGAWNEVLLELCNHAGRSVTFQVRDAVPSLLQARQEAGEGSCQAGATWRLTYRVFPIQRGEYGFGPLTVRYLGPLRLAWRQRTLHFDDQVSVYPNVSAIRRYEGLVRRGLQQEIGLRSSRRWGAGTEFDRLREYAPDDEYRRINWKATARRHSPVVVDYRTEQSQNVIVALDAGRLMSTRLPLVSDLSSEEQHGSRPELVEARALSRLDYSVNAALLLAYVSQKYGDRVGLLAFTDRVIRFLPPRSGKRQYLAILEALHDLKPEPVEADYAVALGYLASRASRRSLIVLFTDIVEADSARPLVSSVSLLARRHLPLTVTLRDPAIEHMASAPVVDSRSVYERGVAQALLSDREELLLRLRQRGALTLDVPADRLSLSLLNRYLQVKARSQL